MRANNDFTGSDTRLYAPINTSSYDPVNALIFNQADHWESDSDGPCPNGQEHFHVMQNVSTTDQRTIPCNLALLELEVLQT